MGENFRSNALYLIPEPSGYAEIEDATGATALFIPTEDDNRIKDESAIIQRALKTARLKRVSHRKGPGKASRSINAMLHGLGTSVSTVGNPPGDRIWFEYLLESFLRLASAHDASLVSGVPTTSSVPTATNEMNIGDLMCIRAAGTNGGRAMWGRAQTAASPILVAPNLPAAPVAGDNSYATRTYSPAVDPGESLDLGDTFTLIENQDGTHYAAPGGCVSGLSISASAGGELMTEAQVQCDERVRQQFANLPDAPVEDPEPIVYVASRVIVNGEEVDVTNVGVNFEILYDELRTGRGRNGRGRPRIKGVNATLAIDPLNDDVYEDLFNTAEVIESILVEFGGDGLVESRLNALAFYMEGAQIMNPPNEQADGNIIRKPLELGACDVNATDYRQFYWQLGIA